MNAKISLFVICVEVIIYLLLCNLHDCTFNGYSVKEMDTLRKEINRLIIKGMSNIYLKITTEKKWRSQNFDFLSFKNLTPGQILGSFNIADIIEFKNLLLQLKNQRFGSKTLYGFYIILILKGIMTFYIQRVHAYCWTKISIDCKKGPRLQVTSVASNQVM